MRYLCKLSFGAAAAAIAALTGIGCNGIDGLYGDNPPPNSPPAIHQALQACTNTAKTCLEDATTGAAAGACVDDLHACTETALHPVAETIAAIRACRETARECLTASADAGDARDECLTEQCACIEDALPPPPPCIQSLDDCLSAGGDKMACFQTAAECIKSTLGSGADGGA
jgi:hypothetical protein